MKLKITVFYLFLQFNRSVLKSFRQNLRTFFHFFGKFRLLRWTATFQANLRTSPFECPYGQVDAIVLEYISNIS